MLFKALDLPNPETFGERYPHQVSGGQLQRAMAAMAMSCRPDILVLDEPTTALDVTTQIEVLALLKKLIREFNTAALYITHDLAVVAQVADRIMVLRHGKMVEVGTAEQVLNAPKTDYARALVNERRAADTMTIETVAKRGEILMELDHVDGALRRLRGGERRHDRPRQGRDGGGGRRIRLGQELAGALHRRPAAALGGRRALPRQVADRPL